MNRSDPLDGADIGETHTVRESVELHTVDLEPDVYRGTDRIGMSTIDSIDIKTDEYGDEVLAVNLEGEVTKTLPYGWNHVHSGTGRSKRSQWWREHAAQLLPIVLPVVLAFGIAMAVANRAFNNLEGKSIEFGPAPTMFDFIPLLIFVLMTTVALQYAPRLIRRT